jgi:hypothetical protein
MNGAPQAGGFVVELIGRSYELTLVVFLAFDPVVQPGFGEAEAEGGVAEDLVGVAFGEIEVVDVAEGWAGRGVDVEAHALAEDGDAEEVGGVGDDDYVMEVVGAGDLGEAGYLLAGVEGVGFGDDRGRGDAVGEEIIAADAAFGFAGVLVGASAEGDDERRDLTLVEGDDVVEARVVDGGRAAEVFGGAEDGDGVGGARLVLMGGVVDLVGDPEAPEQGDEEDERDEAKQETKERVVAATRSSGDGWHEAVKTV